MPPNENGFKPRGLLFGGRDGLWAVHKRNQIEMALAADLIFGDGLRRLSRSRVEGFMVERNANTTG